MSRNGFRTGYRILKILPYVPTIFLVLPWKTFIADFRFFVKYLICTQLMLIL